MSIVNIVAINSVAAIILILIYINGYKLEEQILTHKLFMYLVKINLLLLAVDTLAWVFNEKPDTINYILNYLFNFLLYISAIIPLAFWLVYVDFQIFYDRKRLKKAKTIAMIFLLANTILAVVSLFTGWYFYIDLNNIYHRGPFFGVHMVLCYSLFIYTSLLIIRYRHKIEKKYYKSLLLFPIPQLTGSILQSLFYGLSLNWSCMMLSILIIYFNIQDVGLNTDYLTRVFNRRMLDSYLKEKIKSSTKDNTFAAILIDIDDFKKINDTLGHHVGDEALQESVKLMRSCIKKEDFIARFGGDEFYIVLDIIEKEKLEETVQNLHMAADNYNLHSQKPYKIKFSMGYDIYDIKYNSQFEDFMRHIDKLMYQDKLNNRCLQGA